MCHTKIFNSQHEPSCKFQLPICHYSIVLVIIIIVYYCKKCQQKHHPISLKFNSKRPKLYHSFLHSDDLMALKGFLINTGGGFPQLDWGQLNFKHLGSVYKVRVGSVSVSSDENPSNSTADLQKSVDKRESSVTKKVQKGLSFLPRPLSVTDFSTSSTNHSKVRISFKGLAGAYSEEAALKAYPQCETFPCEEFEDTFKAVELWLADRAILPIENSLSGCIHRNYDLLLRHRLHIVGEIQLAVNFSLLALPGVRLEQLERVLSHPQGLDQCNAFLNKLGVLRESVDDAAGASQLVASNRMMDAGIIASARAAELYGFNILAERIQDDCGNITRFLVLARDPIIPRTDKPFKTSIVFTLDEGPGMLFKALAVFALRDINLTKIESRPQRNQLLRVVDDSNTGTSKR
ncbi:arogenate dehydratase/prephenate dehydratase 1, chloroplastic-like isoform X1 [Olea europaea var. sylvestris]|uniref:arogenate dehydratase/prephenate dehydratase 1, chloroplastic-like isoform X1 n=1 Tax=Olea europaea var. sylvestris TaxID=158386 RepID=UPI000C1CE570|nr:arogenate dehydratase/prephenate dehydratase 1, chloroplastic-like isoform X1 [Olea europaea var. sylvestris]